MFLVSASNLQNLNKAQNEVTPEIPTISIGELETKKKYKIREYKIVTTTYGDCPRVKILYEGEIRHIYLNKRWLEAFSADDIAEINDGRKKFNFVFNGMNGSKFLYSILPIH